MARFLETWKYPEKTQPPSIFQPQEFFIQYKEPTTSKPYGYK